MIQRTTMMMVTLLMLMCGGVDGWSQDKDLSRSFSPNTWILVIDGKDHWNASRSDGIADFTTTKDGHSVITGNTNSHNGDFESLREELMGGLRGTDDDIFVIKRDKKREKDTSVIWKKVFGGTNSESGHSIVATNPTGVLVTGYTFSTDGTFKGVSKGSRRNRSDIFVLKLDDNGEIVWVKTIGGSEDEDGHCLNVTIDGGIVITGATSSNDGDFEGINKGESDIFVMKLDRNGVIQWKKTYGGSKGDVGESIVTTSEGDIVITGVTSSNDGDFEGMNKGNTDIFVIKLDKNGELQWKRIFGGTSDDYGSGVTTQSDGGTVITGRISSNDGDFKGMSKKGGSFYRTTDGDIFVIKLDRDGQLLWKRTYGGSSDEWGSKVVTVSDDRVIVSGKTYSNDFDFETINLGGGHIFYMKLDENGNLNPTTGDPKSK